MLSFSGKTTKRNGQGSEKVLQKLFATHQCLKCPCQRALFLVGIPSKSVSKRQRSYRKANPFPGSIFYNKT